METWMDRIQRLIPDPEMHGKVLAKLARVDSEFRNAMLNGFSDVACKAALLGLIDEDYSPPRLAYKVENHVGFANFTIENGSVSYEENLMIDIGCGLQLLFPETFVDRLQLKKVQGAPEISVSVVGGQKYRGVLHEDVKVSYVLRDKVSGNITHRRAKYLTPHVLMDGPDPGGLITYAPVPHEEGIPMDIDAILKISEVDSEDEDEYAAGSGNSILGRAGLLLLDLEVSLSKQYLYPTQVVRAIAF
jgi:hypothetical protein